MEVNGARLEGWIQELAQIGRDGSLGTGLFRGALSDADIQGRKWFMQKLEEHGLQCFVDGAMNIHGRYNWPSGLEKPTPDQPAVVTGSHLDTVLDGGHLDGALGVLVGLEVLVRLKELKVSTKFPLEVIDFTDEEGQFGGIFGSMCMTGKLKAPDIENMVNPGGVKLTEVLEEHGRTAKSAEQCAYQQGSVHAYVELHIEQGPVLDEAKESVAVVTGIVGLWKARFSVKGQANHAGTTPMTRRRNAFLACSLLQVSLGDILKQNGSTDSVATIGFVEVLPGSANVVPGICNFTVECRDIDAAIVSGLGAAVVAKVEAICQQHQLLSSYRIMSDIKPVACDPTVMKVISDAADKLPGLVPSGATCVRHMPSGAAHDAQNIPRIGPMGMIFVPSINGISHDPLEATHFEDIKKGANLLLNALSSLAGAGPLVTSGTVPFSCEAKTSATKRKADQISNTLPSDSLRSKEIVTDTDKRVLLCIDLQQFPPSSSTAEEVAKFQEVQDRVVVPNVKALQLLAREHPDFEVVHCRIQSMTTDGRDCGLLHKKLKIHLPPGSAGAHFLPGVEPVEDELVFNKTASNVFVSTNINFVLSNMRVRELVVVGLLTDECVSSSAKSAADLGYSVTVVSDACAAAAPELHHSAIQTLSRYAEVQTTAEFLATWGRTEVPGHNHGCSC